MKDAVFGFDDFLSPFTWRYGSLEMRNLFSEKSKRAKWREVWVALAEAESKRGLLSEEEVRDIKAYAKRKNVDIAKAHEIERSIRHDLMAELRVFAGQAKKGGGKLHLGATSMDIEDNADIAQFAQATELIILRISECLAALKAQILKYKDLVCMGWTHLQPAEPTTLGYRLSIYAQDLVMDVQLLESLRIGFLKGKGMKGAVGTSASYKALVGDDESVSKIEGDAMKSVGLESFEISTQTYPRKVDYLILSALASVAQSCHKFGLDLRVMQSPAFGELSEPIGEKQVGSSAMPFKRNPVSAERMCSLARFVSVLPGVGFANAANSILERTLDDSASRRIAIPEAFLAVEECLSTFRAIAQNLVVYPEMMRKNLSKYGPFAGTEVVMMKAVERGGDRQEVHERIRAASFRAWEQVMKGKENPMEEYLARIKSISGKITRKELHSLLDARNHIGDAPARCDRFLQMRVQPILNKYGREQPRARRR
jgi:adenylosuccinate lyase